MVYLKIGEQFLFQSPRKLGKPRVWVPFSLDDVSRFMMTGRRVVEQVEGQVFENYVDSVPTFPNFSENLGILEMGGGRGVGAMLRLF